MKRRTKILIGVGVAVAVFLILSVVVPAFVLGRGPICCPPQARISLVSATPSSITLKHENGDPVDLSKISLTSGGQQLPYVSWGPASNNPFVAGETVTLSLGQAVLQNGENVGLDATFTDNRGVQRTMRVASFTVRIA